MYIEYRNRPPGPLNPFAKVLAVIGGAAVLVVSFLMGLVFLAVLAGLIFVGALALAARLAWLRRKMLKAAEAAERSGGSAPLEGEYVVLEEYRRRRPK